MTTTTLIFFRAETSTKNQFVFLTWYDSKSPRSTGPSLESAICRSCRKLWSAIVAEMALAAAASAELFRRMYRIKNQIIITKTANVGIWNRTYRFSIGRNLHHLQERTFLKRKLSRLKLCIFGRFLHELPHSETFLPVSLDIFSWSDSLRTALRMGALLLLFVVVYLGWSETK